MHCFDLPPILIYRHELQWTRRGTMPELEYLKW